MKFKAFKKTTAVMLAVLTLMLTLCFSGLAAGGSTGGAYLSTSEGMFYYENISDAWSKLASSTLGGTLILKDDWKADENGSFGKGSGFLDGAIYLANKTRQVSIHLNGFSIDRGLTEAKDEGCVFFISNCRSFRIFDSSLEKGSKITGGFNKDDGGAFDIKGSNVEIRNLTICGNITEERGGAIYVQTYPSPTSNVLSTVTVDNCLITENEAEKGGAVYMEASQRLSVYDSVITGNKAKHDAGIHTEVKLFNISRITLGGKVVIADNEAEVDGTGLMLDESVFTKAIVRYDSSRPLRAGSKIVILSKTGDNTLRITDDSDSYNLECFEYENDDYEIIKKGSGSEKYLDIKKA